MSIWDEAFNENRLGSGIFPHPDKLLKLIPRNMNEIYTDMEQKNIIDRINDLFSSISRELGIRNLNDNIVIEVECSEQDRERMFQELSEEYKKQGIMKVMTGETEGAKLSSFETPFGKLKLISNGK